MPKHSVITVCWNKLVEVSQPCIPTFYQTSEDWQFIVVSNGCNDGTLDWLLGQQKEHPEVPLEIVPLEENRGYSGGINAGLAIAEGEFVTVQNNDLVCHHPKWATALVAPLEENPRRLVGARLIVDNELANVGAGPVHYLEGWLLSATRKFWDEAQGMDGRLIPAWFEDVDLSWRAQELGYELHANPDAGVMHLFGHTAYRSGLDFQAITRKNKNIFTDVYYGRLPMWHELTSEERAALNGSVH